MQKCSPRVHSRADIFAFEKNAEHLQIRRSVIWVKSPKSHKRAAQNVRLSLSQRGEKKLSRDAAHRGGAIVMLPHDVRELPYAPFWGLNAAHREDGVFSFTPTATRKREPWGRGRGAIVMLPHDVRELPLGSFLGTQCSAPLHGAFSFMRDCFRASAAALAGAIGIEPTPWESEAHVLPLHQAPTRE